VIKEAISNLIEGRSLSLEEASGVMNEIMEGNTTPSQLGAFLTALRIKGETPDEVAGLAGAMRAKAIEVRAGEPVLDVVGTGGDGLNTFNISTASALVAAGAGIKVAKHGNRSASSRCGSADVLEKLGVKIDLTAEQVQNCIHEVGFGFIFAPAFHPAMKYAAPTRREIAIRTVFNLLGPLTNPARAEFQVIGVPSLNVAENIVGALIKLKVPHALVVHADNGMDELSISGESLYWEIRSGTLATGRRKISPQLLGLKQATLESIQGGTAEENAGIIREVLSGRAGPCFDVVLMNSAAGFIASDRTGNWAEAVALARQVILDGRALARLNHLIEFTRQYEANPL
jgi:anthranilate phosphoribosyltransferase